MDPHGNVTSWRCELLDIFEGGMEELIYGFPLNVMELMKDFSGVFNLPFKF